MAELTQYLLNGISQGCVYVLLASGLTILLGIMNVPNFAQGHLYMVAAYLGFYMVMSYAMNYWLALVLATFALGILGLFVYFLVFYPVRKAPEVNLFVAAMALLMILEGGALYLFGTETKWFLIPWSRSVSSVRRDLVPGTARDRHSGDDRRHAGTLALHQEDCSRCRPRSNGAAPGRRAALRDKGESYLCDGLCRGHRARGRSGRSHWSRGAPEPTMGMEPLLVAFSAIIFGGLGSVPGAVVGRFSLES